MINILLIQEKLDKIIIMYYMPRDEYNNHTSSNNIYVDEHNSMFLAYDIQREGSKPEWIIVHEKSMDITYDLDYPYDAFVKTDWGIITTCDYNVPIIIKYLHNSCFSNLVVVEYDYLNSHSNYQRPKAIYNNGHIINENDIEYIMRKHAELAQEYYGKAFTYFNPDEHEMLINIEE